MSNSQVKLLCGTFIVLKFKKGIGGNFVRMNETKNAVTNEEVNAERNIAGIYIRVSTEDQVRERF